MLAWLFDECRESQIPRPLGRKEQVRSCPVACCGVFDFLVIMEKGRKDICGEWNLNILPVLLLKFRLCVRLCIV